MSERNLHKHPWPQKLLYEYGLDTTKKGFYEEWEYTGDEFVYGFRNLQSSTNILVKFDATGIPP